LLPGVLLATGGTKSASPFSPGQLCCSAEFRELPRRWCAGESPWAEEETDCCVLPEFIYYLVVVMCILSLLPWVVSG